MLSVFLCTRKGRGRKKSDEEARQKEKQKDTQKEKQKERKLKSVRGTHDKEKTCSKSEKISDWSKGCAILDSF